jgi:GST-like protein
MRYAPEKIDYAIERYSQEAVRLTRILERRLGEAAYLGGDEYSIADMAVWPSQRFSAADAAQYPNTHRWSALIAERPAVARGLAAERAIPSKYMQRHAVLTPAQWSNMFGDRMRGAVDL